MRNTLQNRPAKTVMLGLCTLILLAHGGAAMAANTVESAGDHMLWTISTDKGNSPKGYLLGAVHVMKPAVYPLDEVYQKAFARSGVAVFELNIDKEKLEAPRLIRKLGLYGPNESLKGTLSSGTYQALQSIAGQLGTPMALLGRMEPWLVAITLTSEQFRQAGYRSQAGIDMHFFAQANKTDKKIVALETAAYQFKLFDDLSIAQQKQLLKNTLDEIRRGPAIFKKIISAWKNGDAKRLAALLNDDMRETPKLYRKLIVKRNQTWLPRITAMLDAKRRPIIIVGAGHLVGEHGLVALLRKAGYTVTQQ